MVHVGSVNKPSLFKNNFFSTVGFVLWGIHYLKVKLSAESTEP